MSCHCNDRLDLGAERYLVRGETIHTSIGCFHASLFLGGDGERFILANARDATMAMCPDCSIPVVLGEFPQHFRDHRLPATDAELASWKKGVEDANRLSQRERAAADAARAELAALRPEVLAFARVMSAKIDGHNHDRGEHGWRSATPAHLMGWLESYVTALSYALDASTMDAVLGKAANVANLAMMIADVAGALAAAKEPAPVPTVVTGCQMKDTPETRELVAAAGRILAAPRPPKHACAGSGCPVCEKWMDDPRALSAPPPGEERLRERIEKIADECDAAAAVSEVDILGREVDGRRVAARLRAALREDENGAKP
jgi:hypothetical protein